MSLISQTPHGVPPKIGDSLGPLLADDARKEVFPQAPVYSSFSIREASWMTCSAAAGANGLLRTS